VKTGGLFFGGLVVFFAIVDIVYWSLSHEAAGTTALALTAGLCLLIAFYLLFTERRMQALPEDRPDADVDEGAGEVGFFSPHSWWPLAVAASAAVLFLGLVFGWWLFAIGAVLLALSTIGFVFEYYTPTA
jgi:hypothetical protein